VVPIHPNAFNAARSGWGASRAKSDPGMRDDHVQARVAASNQLQALLDAHWPGAVRIFADLAGEIALDFLERCPTAPFGEPRLAAFLKRLSRGGRRSPAELLERQRRAPSAPCRHDPEVLA